MFGNRFSSSTSCSRWLHETESDRSNQSLSCCFLKVATHPLREIQGEVLHDFELTVKANDEINWRRSSVSFQSDYVGLSCNGPVQELPFRQAIDFLKARRRWTAKVPDPLWEIMNFLFLPAAFFLIYAALASAGYVSGPLLFVVFLFSVCIFFLVSALGWLAKIHRNLLFLKKRHEHAGFFRRNESHIVKAGIGLVAGIVGYVIRLLQE